jgi:hypothetical protein
MGVYYQTVSETSSDGAGSITMKFALNYSPQAAELLRNGRIDIDLFKSPPWEEIAPKAQKLKPVYVHFEFQAGWNRVEPAQLRSAEMWLARTGTRYVNTHIVPRFEALKQPDDAEELIALVLHDLMPLVENFGAERVIAENIPYPETMRTMPRLSIDPAVITEIIERSGCGLLLDIGHARRTAEHLAIDPRIYIEQLPVHRLCEIHILGSATTKWASASIICRCARMTGSCSAGHWITFAPAHGQHRGSLPANTVV